MRKKTKRYFSAMLAAIFVVSATAGGVDTQAVRAEQTDENDTAVELSTEQVEAFNGEVSLTRTSVHDPSVIMDGSGNYYIFGSHMGVSKTSDLQNWTSVTGETTDSTLFGNAAGEVVPYTEAFTENAYTGSVTILDEAGNPYEVDFGSYDAATWISDNTVAGNMWAPDVIYNELMGKWCLYMSLNGATWNTTFFLRIMQRRMVGTVFSAFIIAKPEVAFRSRARLIFVTTIMREIGWILINREQAEITSLLLLQARKLLQ